MRKYDLLAIDMDGTLLHTDSSLSDKNREALYHFHEAGGKTVLISGRPDLMTLPYVHELGDVDLYAAYNGALLADKNRNVLFSREIEEETAEKTCDCLKEKGFEFSILFREGIYSNKRSFSEFGKQNELVDRLAEKHGTPKGVLLPLEKRKDEAVYKFVVFKKEEEEENREVLERLQKDSSLTVTSSRPSIYDVSAEGVDKGLAVRTARKALEIEKEKVCVIGDFYNDVPMFQEAGLSIAMGNAPEEVRQKADKTVSSNNEDGVAEAIEKYLL
jgi:Cof subfamily protein (haloacid dehalogenase superfamily)